MKKSQKITAAFFMIAATILFIVVGVWNPCSYAMIVPAFLAIVGISIALIAWVQAKNENRQLALNA